MVLLQGSAVESLANARTLKSWRGLLLAVVSSLFGKNDSAHLEGQRARSGVGDDEGRRKRTMHKQDRDVGSL